MVYVLTSSRKDIYLEQAYVSMCSVRHHTPGAVITLVVDELTVANLTGMRREEIRYVDKIVTVKTPAGLNAQQRSRYLKTSVRSYVEGDFLFIDTDTLIVKPLYDILFTEADISACYDSHSASFHDNPYYNMCVKHGHRLGWSVENEEHYFNSGVIYVRDTEVARRFYALWHKTMKESVEKGVTMDQPAFAKTNYLMGHIVSPLDDTWNCQLKHGMRYLRDARVVHYLCTAISKDNDNQLFIMNEKSVLLRIKQNGEMPQEVLKTMDDPFVGLTSTSMCIAGRDMYLFNTVSYIYLRKLYDTWFFNWMESIVSLYVRVSKSIHSLHRKTKP